MKTLPQVGLRSAVLAAAALALLQSGAAQAQDYDLPAVPSPLRSDPDPNGVNLLDGKKIVEMPVALSVPADPRLTFDRAQNAMPMIVGTIDHNAPDTPGSSRWSVHYGEERSESFRCENDDVCNSVTASGSDFRFASRNVQQAGTGALYNFRVVQSKSSSTRDTEARIASTVSSPDGEVISYEYEGAANPGFTDCRVTLSANCQTIYRPTKISSNTGYYIKLTYDPATPLGNVAWGMPIQAAIYSPANDLIRRLVYASDGTITDYGNSTANSGGRIFRTTGVGHALGDALETSNATVGLPGEASSQIVVQGSNSHGDWKGPLIDSVARDGVVWTYSYATARGDLAVWPDTYVLRYDSVTVAGPNGYNVTYAMFPNSAFSTANNHNLIKSRTDALGHTTSYDYESGSDRLYKVTFPEGNYVAVAYDQCGNVTSKTTVPKAGSGLTNISEGATYPVSGGITTCPNVLYYRPTSSTDARRNVTDYSYNSLGQLTQELAPADANGVRRETDITYATNAVGISLRTLVRVCGQTTTCAGSAESHTEYTYSGNTALPATVTQVDENLPDTNPAKRRTTTYTYDPGGRPTVIDGPLPGTDDAKYFQYDKYGRKVLEIGERADGTANLRLAKKFVYHDSDDKVAQAIAGTVNCLTNCHTATLTPTVLNQTDTTYDSRRYPIRETTCDPNGAMDCQSVGATVYSVTDRSFLDRGLETCTTVRMNFTGSTPTSTSACALETQGSEGPDRITKNTYDSAGQLTKVQKAYLTSDQADYATYTYTPNGKQQYVTDANGNKAQFTYDGFDRLLKWNFPDKVTKGAVASTDYEQYGYDANGNRTSLRKRDARTISYSYDRLNRVTHKGGDVGDVDYSYDIAGRQLTAKFSTGGQGITNTYNGFGDLTAATSDVGGTARTLRYNYDTAGRRTQIIYPENGSSYTFTYAYDALNRPSYLCRGAGTCDSASATLLDTFTYASNGLPASRVDVVGSSVAYRWDDIGRLTCQLDLFGGTTSSTCASTSGTGNVLRTFGFNSASQMDTETRDNDAYAWTGAVTVNRPYAVNGLNQYTTAGPASFTYDANGNLTGDGTWTYTYDAENRLATAVGPGISATLSYDPLGRLWKYAGTGVNDVIFLYDGDALVAEYNPSTGAMTNRYVHGPNAAADDPLVWYSGASVANTGRHWLHADHLGSIAATTDSSGANPTINTYDEYGIPGSANVGRFGYTGQVWLAEIGLDYYKARIYSPTLGRFLQTDPVGYEGGINLYGYVENDPIDHADPSGLCAENTCPVSGIWGSTEDNLETRQVEESAGVVGLPILGAALLTTGAAAIIDYVAIRNTVAVGIKGLQHLYRGAREAKVSEVMKWARNEGFRQTQTRGGPIKFMDDNGISRLTIKNGSQRAPGSGEPHIEVRDATGQRINPRTGERVSRRSPENHTPVKPDRGSDFCRYSDAICRIRDRDWYR